MITDGFEKCGINSQEVNNLAKKMDLYINEIILFNSAYNLTNTSDHDELLIRHIYDSLAAYIPLKSLIQENNCSDFVIGDIGSGGGLPGIPLAAAFPQINFNLVERMSKRCAFLENCAAVLGLKNVKVINCEAEKVPAESMNISVFRAFRPLDSAMIKTLLALTKQNGYLVAYKAKLENIKEEMNQIKEIVPSYKIENLSVPYLTDVERNLVIIKKE